MKIIITYFFLLINIASFSQEIKATYIKSTSLKADKFIGIDKFNNWYYVYNNILYKKKGDLTESYANFQLGDISYVSIKNTFKILVFYRDYNTVVILDNHLNKKQQFTFINKTITHISSTFGDNIWTYNLDNQQLQLYNYKLERNTITTQPSVVLKVKSLKSNTNNVYVLDKTGSIYQFDNYGTLVKYDKSLAADKIFVLEKHFLYLKNNILFLNISYPLKFIFAKNTIIKDIYLNKNDLFIFDGNKILQFKLSKGA